MKNLLLTTILIAMSLIAYSNPVPKKIVRIYNLNLIGNKVQEAQIKESAKWPVISVKIIGKNIIKYTFYTSEYKN